MVIRQIGAVNVSFECTLVNNEGEQILTQWVIRDFRGVPGGQDIITVLPDTILLGEPQPQPANFATFRNMLLFPEFLEDFDGATLTCGNPAISGNSLDTAQWPLRVFRECV